MYGVELYWAVRLSVVDEGLSHREAARRFGIDRRTVKKMLSYSAPRAPAGRSRSGVRSWGASPASSMRSWRRTGIRPCRASSDMRDLRADTLLPHAEMNMRAQDVPHGEIRILNQRLIDNPDRIAAIDIECMERHCDSVFHPDH